MPYGRLNYTVSRRVMMRMASLVVQEKGDVAAELPHPTPADLMSSLPSFISVLARDCGVRLPIYLATGLKIVINGIMKGFLQFLDRLCLEGDDIIDTSKSARKYAVVQLKPNVGMLAFIRREGHVHRIVRINGIMLGLIRGHKICHGFQSITIRTAAFGVEEHQPLNLSNGGIQIFIVPDLLDIHHFPGFNVF